MPLSGLCRTIVSGQDPPTVFTASLCATRGTMDETFKACRVSVEGAMRNNWVCRGWGREVVILGIMFLLHCLGAGIAPAAEPQRLVTARGGDCAACHADDAKLPASHMDTKGMDLKQCLGCHGQDDPELTNTLPLSHTHLLGGISCAACHGDADPPEFVGTGHCLTCHPTEQLVAATKDVKEGNPHNSHYGPELDCDLCHHAHAPSENFCNQCHDFTFVIPSPIAEPEKVAAGAQAGGAQEQSEPAESKPSCQDCHGQPEYGERFAGSVHGILACSTCHTGIDDISAHAQKKQVPGLTDCASCHKDVASRYEYDVHALKAAQACVDCHTDVHVRMKDAGASKAAVINRCALCHETEMYAFLGHGNAVLQGNEDAAACSDCHGLHDIPSYADTVQGRAQERESYTLACRSCHDDQELAERNGLNPFVAAGYEETYHGKVLAIGYPERAAGCPDCHNGHNILPPDDPRSTVHPDNLVEDCAQCHEGFHRRFVAYVAHPDHKDQARYPVLFWTNVFMLALLFFVFLFFWVHTILWWRKAYWHKWRQRKAVPADAQPAPREDLSIYVQRFSWRDRIMHLLLILSFFMLVMTGFPLKYHETQWARFLIDLWGGTEMAGYLHRASAIVLWALFLYTCWLSLRFLFPGAKAQGWVGRLFGPESLFFNLEDWEDLKGMLRWFFDRGEMPRFDRWTYWEKFDFFAVFWGMFIIGLSGLVLWFPEGFSYVMPGWMINVAAVAHSEEAFLAAIFIFTVHFFHNHLVPNKFPMESNIFTGRYTISALKEERPEEYERIIAENRLEGLKRKQPGPFDQLVAAGIGIASVLLGLLLTILIFWAVLFS